MHKKGVMYSSGLVHSDFMGSATAFIQKDDLTNPVFVLLVFGYILSVPIWTGSSCCTAAQHAALTVLLGFNRLCCYDICSLQGFGSGSTPSLLVLLSKRWIKSRDVLAS